VPMPTPPTTAATYHRAPPTTAATYHRAPPTTFSSTTSNTTSRTTSRTTTTQAPSSRCTPPHEVTSFLIFIFLLKDNSGIFKFYGGARRNHGGAGRSCLENRATSNFKDKVECPAEGNDREEPNVPRRPNRQTKQPFWMRDFIRN